jgi:hypothetical protein
MVVFGLMVKFRESFFEDEDKIRALVGSRLGEARRDPAFAAIVSTILRGIRETPGVSLVMHAASSSHTRRTVGGRMSGFLRWLCTTARIHSFHLLMPRKQPNFCLAASCAFRLGGHVLWTGVEAAPCPAPVSNSYASSAEPRGTV